MKTDLVKLATSAINPSKSNGQNNRKDFQGDDGNKKANSKWSWKKVALKENDLKEKATIDVQTTKHGFYTSHQIAKANHGRKKRWAMESQIKRQQP